MTKRNLILFHFISLFPSSSFAIAFLSFQSLLSFCSKVERATNQPQTVQFSYSFDVSFGWVLVSEWLLRVNWLLLLLIVDVDVVVVVNVVVDVVVIVVVIFVVVIFCCCCCCYCHYCCCSLSLLLLSSSLLLLSSSLSSSMSSLLSATFWQKQQLLVRFAGSQDLITLIRWNFHTLLLLLPMFYRASICCLLCYYTLPLCTTTALSLSMCAHMYRVLNLSVLLLS